MLPPIERLCDPIQGTDRSRLAECLGLDPKRYQNSSSNTNGESGVAFSSLDSQISDAQRFAEAKPFIIRCRHCTNTNQIFTPISDRENPIVLPTGPTCPACHKLYGTASLRAQLEVQIREYIALYYQGWTVCEDKTCENRTRMMGVYGRRCLRPDCRGTVRFEVSIFCSLVSAGFNVKLQQYSDVKLYNQLRYLSDLFDSDKLLKFSTGSSDAEVIKSCILQNSEFLATMSAAVEKYLDQCGRRWIDMASVFSFMKV